VRCLVTGVDDTGSSYVVEEREVMFSEMSPGLSVDGLFRTADSPPPSRPQGRGALVDLGVEPGRCSWSLFRFEPGAEVAVHHTDTLDFDVIVEGSVELILDDGTHLLEAGDCVVMTGVDHAWRAGATGCTAGAIAIGTPPPDSDER
jgi:quercetin dioxygenase-like cupin family protein